MIQRHFLGSYGNTRSLAGIVKCFPMVSSIVTEKRQVLKRDVRDYEGMQDNFKHLVFQFA